MTTKGFTLIELQVSLLLTFATLGSLFLFSFYFWQNHLQQQHILSFQKEADLFFDWHHQQMRNAVGFQKSKNHIRYQLLSGRTTVLEQHQEGLRTGTVQFFSQSTSASINFTKQANHTHVHIKLLNQQLNLEREWQLTYPPVTSIRLGESL